MKRRLLILLFPLLCLHGILFAFKSGFQVSDVDYISNVHRSILSRALQSGEIGMTEANLSIIDQGAASQDDLNSPKFISSPQNHCDENMLSQCHSYFLDRFRVAVQESRNAFKDVDPTDPNSSLYKALYALGEGLHTMQDFYAHSNYLEWLLKNNKPLQRVDWNNLPGFLRTGSFYYDAKSANEYLIIYNWMATAGTGIHSDLQANARQDIIQVLIQKQGLKNFQPREKFIKLKESNGDYNTAIDYALSDRDYLHWELNKDDPKQPQGSVITPNGSTLTDLAQQLAVEDTKYQWDQFRSEVCKEYNFHCSWIIPSLKGTRKFPTITLTLNPSPTVEPGETITGTVRVQLVDMEPQSLQNVRVFMTMSSPSKISDEKKFLFNGPMGDTGDYMLTLENDLPLTAPDQEGKITLTVSADYEEDPTVQSGTMIFYKATAEIQVEAEEEQEEDDEEEFEPQTETLPEDEAESQIEDWPEDDSEAEQLAEEFANAGETDNDDDSEDTVETWPEDDHEPEQTTTQTPPLPPASKCDVTGRWRRSGWTAYALFNITQSGNKIQWVHDYLWGAGMRQEVANGTITEEGSGASILVEINYAEPDGTHSKATYGGTVTCENGKATSVFWNNNSTIVREQ